MTWVRCNGSYQKHEDVQTVFVDPVSWTLVVVSPEEAGSLYAKAVQWRAPGFNEKALLERGVSEQIIDSVREWSRELAVAKEQMKSPEEMHQIFAEAPENVKADVLDGVIDLIFGLDDMSAGFFERNWVSMETALALKKGSRADQNLDRIKRKYSSRIFGKSIGIPPMIFMGDDIPEALHEALKYFGIKPC